MRKAEEQMAQQEREEKVKKEAAKEAAIEASVQMQKRKAEQLNDEARSLLRPMVQTIQRTGIVQILEELVKTKKLTKEVREPESASPQVIFFVTHWAKPGTDKRVDNVKFVGLELDGGFGQYIRQYAENGEEDEVVKRLSKLRACKRMWLEYPPRVGLKWGYYTYYSPYTWNDEDSDWNEILFLFDKVDHGFALSARAGRGNTFPEVDQLPERDWSTQTIEQLVAKTYLAEVQS